MLRTFLIGAIGYPMLEVLYRGRTHYSMALAGGCSACIIRCVEATKHRWWAKAMICGSGISAVEWICGTIWNRDHQVWDYSQIPMNYRGQICLPYSLLWCGMSACILPLFKQKETSRS